MNFSFKKFSDLYKCARKSSSESEFQENVKTSIPSIDERATKAVWEVARMDMKSIRERMGLNKTKFSELYGIPYKTIQSWESDTKMHRDPPDYLVMVIAYTAIVEELYSENA